MDNGIKPTRAAAAVATNITLDYSSVDMVNIVVIVCIDSVGIVVNAVGMHVVNSITNSDHVARSLIVQERNKYCIKDRGHQPKAQNVNCNLRSR
jgi:hypothetical protein